MPIRIGIVKHFSHEKWIFKEKRGSSDHNQEGGSSDRSLKPNSFS
jgi:hypothetical protein